MMKEVIVSGITGTVSATTGIAQALTAALSVYISLRLVKTALTPPPATLPEESLREGHLIYDFDVGLNHPLDHPEFAGIDPVQPTY